MDSITLKDYRCFHEEQTARLAPLTLLVGENSTGKTSFMAMIRGLRDAAFDHGPLDFKKEPYDLGSFDEIAHYRGGKGGRAETFEAGFSTPSPKMHPIDFEDELYNFEITFEQKGTVPVPVRRLFRLEDTWIEEKYEKGQPSLRVGTRRGTWEVPASYSARLDIDDTRTFPLFLIVGIDLGRDGGAGSRTFTSIDGSPDYNQEDQELLYRLISFGRMSNQQIFASTPVRSKPRRTYDPAHPTRDPDGDYVPMYLADMYFQDKERWEHLKERLEEFGRSAGLFDEIAIRPLGKRGSEPFQVQVRKEGRRLKGPMRNLIDMGYGVSQVLPVITELLRENAPNLFLLQQPEVHLHPSAQAALGSLFCKEAGPNCQLVVETHSDYLLDRVRMDVRDGKTNLKPNDISILFFERDNLDVRIHSLRLDEEGNIIGAPDGYRDFFKEETTRFLKL